MTQSMCTAFFVTGPKLRESAALVWLFYHRCKNDVLIRSRPTPVLSKTHHCPKRIRLHVYGDGNAVCGMTGKETHLMWFPTIHNLSCIWNTRMVALDISWLRYSKGPFGTIVVERGGGPRIRDSCSDDVCCDDLCRILMVDAIRTKV